MKFVFVLALLPFIAASRAKRFTALTSAIGGNAGCVVTGNKLYANGFEQRELTAAEQSELVTYEAAVEEYKKKVKTAIEAQREAMRKKLKEMMQNGETDEVVHDADESIEAPARPSFCSEATTTQYYFDGCMVQNNKVYVGKTFARNLSDAEVEQLKTFDTAMTAYQKQVQDSIHQQVKGLFGGNNFFNSIFGAQNKEEVATTTTVAPSDTTEKPLSAPEAPKFCTSI